MCTRTLHWKLGVAHCPALAVPTSLWHSCTVSGPDGPGSSHGLSEQEGDQLGERTAGSIAGALHASARRASVVQAAGETAVSKLLHAVVGLAEVLGEEQQGMDACQDGQQSLMLL